LGRDNVDKRLETFAASRLPEFGMYCFSQLLVAVDDSHYSTEAVCCSADAMDWL
jgi:hypothetical protein